MQSLDIILRIIAFICGAGVTFWTINQAIRSFILPRNDRAWLTRATFRFFRWLLLLRLGQSATFKRRDIALAMLSPVAMFCLPLVWLSLIVVAYTFMYWAINPDMAIFEAFILSGSSLLTLGFAFQDNVFMILLEFTQASLGMMLIALMIGYIPTMYSAFSQREAMVTKLETFASTPPEPAEMIMRLGYLGILQNPDKLFDFFSDWQDWFVQIEENHTTLAPMNFFRSPKPDRHWVVAVLDCSAILASSVKYDEIHRVSIVIRSGFLALRSIAVTYEIDFDPDPQPNDPISVTREEFDAVLDRLASMGAPIHENRDDCWDHFSGWRVNYDEVLIGLAKVTHAPYGYWSSDRAFDWHEDDIPALHQTGLVRIREREG